MRRGNTHMRVNMPRDAVAKFLDMVCVVLKVREDNGRKPMPLPRLSDAEGGLCLGTALFR